MNTLKKLVVRKTAAYLLSLPEGSAITMYQAARDAAPEEMKRIDPMELMALWSDVEELVNQSGILLDMSEHENKLEGLLFNLDFVIRKQA